MTLDERLAGITPSERQIAFQQLEFYSFVHFTVNTFTDKEWGDGNEKPQIFNPEKLDAEQWVKAVKAAGMKGMILTCKHHDGFCLWPSKYKYLLLVLFFFFVCNLKCLTSAVTLMSCQHFIFVRQ